MKDEALALRCRRLKLLLSDVDGVMTDGSLLLLADGSEAKAFNVRDGLGLVLAQRAGLRTGLLSGRSSEAVTRRAAELKLDVVVQGAADKAAALRGILTEQGLEASEVAYIGDDVQDIPVLRRVGLPVCVANGTRAARREAKYVTKRAGGHGAVREVIDLVLSVQAAAPRASTS